MSKAVTIPECKKNIGGLKEEICISPTEKKESAIGLFSRFLRLDSLSKKSCSLDSPTSSEPPVSHYGVYIPCEIRKGSDEEVLHVYKNKMEALEVVRRYKLSRFKAFQNRQDAITFALRGAEPDHGEGNDTTVMSEKPYPFKAPSPQDMVSLRKAIENGLVSTVRDRIWDNPRYLVSGGNSPAILQEGSRYNALHISAKSLNAEICNLVLTTVGNPSFVQSLYGNDADPNACKEFAAILVDRYLNTPDKAMNETPLHFAAKFGAEEVVDVLTSFPQCNKTCVNKFGYQPKDIICERASKSSPETARRISELLQERFYVPVLHSEDDTAQPTIGKPFTPAQPPEINPDPLSPRFEIRAYAGPMDVCHAETFRKQWKTPPRSKPTFRLNEMTKGLETAGRDLAEKLKIGWKEYWPFLDTFTDLRTKEGLTIFENYLRNKYETACSFAFSESIQSHCPEDLSLSRISLGNVSLNSPTKDSVLSPVSELCVAMKTCSISNDRSPLWRKTDPIRQRMCRQPNLKYTSSNGESTPVNHTVSQLLCIERTCQVFAKRIADSLMSSLAAEPEVAGEYLKSEARHLQHTISSYMDDERFQKINFTLIHSRLAQLAVFLLKQKTQYLDDINNLVEFLVKLRCPNDDIFSSDDERKPNSYRGYSKVMKMTHVIDNHVRCLASFICEELTESEVAKGPSMSENECNEVWEKASKCRCDWKVESERNSKKNASFRKNRSNLSTSPQSESFIRRLIFEQEIGDGRQQQPCMEKPVSNNSPAGDALYTIDVTKCQVLQAEISEDESSERSDEEAYLTASEHSEREFDVMEDASDRALVEPFIYGEEPSKMDRLVYEALCDSSVDCRQFPYIYRWRHTVALYSPTERKLWRCSDVTDESSWVRVATPPRLRVLPRVSTPTPTAARLNLTASTLSHNLSNASDDKTPSLQVSNWLRVTGPNSPRAALATKNVSHNVSFGF